MPTFDFTSPEGKTYSVDGPEGATKEQAFQILQQHLGGKPEESSSTLGGLAKSVGTGLAQGAIGLATFPADISNQLMPTPGPHLGSEMVQKAIEKYTGPFHKPEGAAEETAAKIGSLIPAVIGGPEGLATKIATRVAVPAITSEAAGKLTEGTPYQPYAEMLGGLAGGLGATAAARKFQQMAAARTAAGTLPSGEDILAKGASQFDQARNMDVQVKPDFAKNTAQDMRDAVKDYDPEQIKPVLNAVGRMEELYKPTPPNPYNTLQPVKPTPPIDMNEVENIRKQLSGLRTSPDATLRTAAKTAQEAITKNQMGLTAADAVKGDAPLYAQTIKDAVGNYAAGKRSLIVQGKQDLADLNAATAGSGANIDNGTRQAFKQLARPMNNTNVPVAKKLGFNDAEIAAINQAARGTVVGNTARAIGKGAPTGIVSAAGGFGLGHALGGPVGAVAVPAVGYIAKKIGDLSTRRAVSTLDSLVRSRSPLASQVAAQLPQITNQLPAKTQRLLRLPRVGPASSENREPPATAPTHQDTTVRLAGMEKAKQQALQAADRHDAMLNADVESRGYALTPEERATYRDLARSARLNAASIDREISRLRGN